MACLRILVISDLYPPASFGGYELECRAVVEHLRTTHEVYVLASDRGRLGQEPGVWRTLPYSGAGRGAAVLAPVHALRAQRVVRQALAQARPELVFVWNATAIPTAAVRIAVDEGAPVVHRLCERWFAERLLLADHFMGRLAVREGGLRGAWGWVLRLANLHPRLRLDPRAPYVAALSWNSNALRNSVAVPAFVELVLERTVHPATPNAERFAALTRRPADRPSVIFVGRVSQQKGADVAVRALGVLERVHGVRADLVFAGPYQPDMRRRLVAEAIAAGASGRLEFRGMLGQDALGEALRAAHVMVVPSAAEAFGLACIEGAAARVPVVASRVDGIPEALHEGEHALLFTPGDAEGCAAALADALGDDAATAARVQRASLRARELSLERYLKAMDAFLADAVRLVGARGSI